MKGINISFESLDLDWVKSQQAVYKVVRCKDPRVNLLF